MSGVKIILSIVALLALVAPSFAFDHQHTQWDAELKTYVHWLPSGVDSQVDYAHWQHSKNGLIAYLDQLSAVTREQYNSWSIAQKKAFLINAYNALTVELVLQHYPEVDSIKQIGGWFRSPWRLKFFDLLGQPMSLDDIEHRYLRQRGVFDDPRIHFVIVCASVSCPPLSDQAYRAARLDGQLTDATSRFLSDPQRNRYDKNTTTLWLSPIFKWFKDDFVESKANGTLVDFVWPYWEELADTQQGQDITRGGSVTVKFLDYDWHLNDYKP